MQAEVRYFHSPDIPDLDGFRQPIDASAEALVQCFIGPRDSPGEESFDLTVRTLDLGLRRFERDAVVPRRGELLVTAFSWDQIEKYLRGVVEKVAGRDWMEVAEKLDLCLGYWECDNPEPPKIRAILTQITSIGSPSWEDLPEFFELDADIELDLILTVEDQSLTQRSDFGLKVLSIRPFLQQHQNQVVLPRTHELLITKFDKRRVESYLRRNVSSIAGRDWQEVADKLTLSLARFL